MSPSTNQFTVTERDLPAERRQRLRRVAAPAAAALAVLLTGLAGAWYLTPPPLPTTFEEAQRVVDSPRFQRLSRERRQPYLDVIREQFGSLDPAERQAILDGEAARLAQVEQRRMVLGAIGLMGGQQRISGLRVQRATPAQGPADTGEDATPMNLSFPDLLESGSGQDIANMGELISSIRPAVKQLKLQQ